MLLSPGWGAGGGNRPREGGLVGTLAAGSVPGCSRCCSLLARSPPSLPLQPLAWVLGRWEAAPLPQEFQGGLCAGLWARGGGVRRGWVRFPSRCQKAAAEPLPRSSGKLPGLEASPSGGPARSGSPLSPPAEKRAELSLLLPFPIPGGSIRVWKEPVLPS